MCDPVSILVGTLATAAVTGVSGYQANMQNKAMKGAAEAQQKQADQQMKIAEEQIAQQEKALNAPGPKDPYANFYDNMNRKAAGEGIASTSLTGPMGVDPIKLTLGRNTLLGA